MSSLTIHIVLLFAIAYSQIMGGVSCCCLSRAVLANFAAARDVASFGDDQAIPKTALVAKCPRCASSKAAAVKGVHVQQLERCCIGRGDDCQCCKVSAIAIVRAEARYVSFVGPFIAIPALIWGFVPREGRVLMPGHGVPIRFGGTSWQSLAGVWRK